MAEITIISPEGKKVRASEKAFELIYRQNGFKRVTETGFDKGSAEGDETVINRVETSSKRISAEAAIKNIRNKQPRAKAAAKETETE